MIDWRKIVNTEYVGRTGAKFVRRLRIHIDDQGLYIIYEDSQLLR